MRKYGIGALALAALLTSGAPAKAATMTVTGKLVDEGCGLNPEAAKGMPADCQLTCAKKGEPVALLTADGKVYRVGGGLAANNNAKLIAHIGHTVEITGDVTVAGDKSIIAADALTMPKK
jgi:hypothetical protein